MKTQKILGGIFLMYILSTLVLGGSLILDHGTNSLIVYEDMDDLSDKTLNINWSNNLSTYDGNGGEADVVIAIYVPVDYGITSKNNVTIGWNNNNFTFEVNNVSDGNCAELNRIVVEEGRAAPWSTNCTLIVINGTLKNPVAGVGFNLSINATLSDNCANTVNGTCINKTYQLMFSDLITYKKLVNNAVCDVSTYNNTGKGETYCYVNENEAGIPGVNYSYCSVPSNRCYSCAVTGRISGNVTCNITKGIGNTYNATNMSILDTGVPGGKIVSVPSREFTINLRRGWNLISIPLQPANTSLTSVLAPIQGSYTRVYAWNATGSKWVKYAPATSTYALTTLEPGVGYWIFCNNTNGVNLTIKGTSAHVAINLSSGWNLFGWPLIISKDLVASLSPISGNYTRVYAWNATGSKWVKYAPTTSTYSLTTLDPGIGYWIFMNNNKVIYFN